VARRRQKIIIVLTTSPPCDFCHISISVGMGDIRNNYLMLNIVRFDINTIIPFGCFFVYFSCQIGVISTKAST